jgi:hypothetical protein
MMKDNELPISRLKKAIIAQKNVQFPERPVGEMFVQLHDLIYQYDQHVSQIVISVLQGSEDVKPFEKKSEIDNLLQQMSQSSNAMEIRTLEQFRRYKERIDKLNSLAIEVVSTRK